VEVGPPAASPFASGAMRTSVLDAILLDIDVPDRIIGRTSTRILEPSPTGSTEHVRNVVYSCGALAHRDTLLILACNLLAVRVQVDWAAAAQHGTRRARTRCNARSAGRHRAPGKDTCR
jgi:hypothetical protein